MDSRSTDVESGVSVRYVYSCSICSFVPKLTEGLGLPALADRRGIAIRNSIYDGEYDFVSVFVYGYEFDIVYARIYAPYASSGRSSRLPTLLEQPREGRGE